MRIWLDTEFNGFCGPLISLALVDENGREWYEVLRCVEPAPWVKENVIPALRKRAIAPDRFRPSLARWLRHYDSVHVIATWPEDFVHFCAALVAGPGERFIVSPLTMELLVLDQQPVSALRHNALEDAKALKQAHIARLADSQNWSKGNSFE